MPPLGKITSPDFLIGDLAAYTKWSEQFDTLTESDRQAIRTKGISLRQRPKFSLVLLSPIAKFTFQDFFTQLQRQLYSNWELWVPAHIDELGLTDFEHYLRTLPATHCNRINSADFFNNVCGVAEGLFIVPLLLDCIVAEHALYEFAVAVNEHGEFDLVYSDEDRLDAAGRRCFPRFKTAWDPDLMLGRDAVGHLTAYSRSALSRWGGMQSGLPHDLALYDLALRIGTAVGPDAIHHVPAVLCHRRGASEAVMSWDAEGARGVVRSHLDRSGGTKAEVVPAPLAPGWNRVIRLLPSQAPLVSVIVPTRDHAHLIARCADAVLARTDYAPLELLVVDNDSKEASALAILSQLALNPQVRVIRHQGAFNYSRINNQAAQQARGEILVLLNDDTDAINPYWLRELVSHALRPDIGAVGAKLLYGDGRVQHAGLVLGPDGLMTPMLRLSHPDDPGQAGELALVRTVSAVTGACLAMRRSVYFEVGGLDEQNLAVAFNDVDLCLRIADHGYRVLWTPFAELFHLESVSRGFEDTPEKRTRWMEEWTHVRRVWGSLLESDPFHNPNLIFRQDDTVLACPPRRARSWS